MLRWTLFDSLERRCWTTFPFGSTHSYSTPLGTLKDIEHFQHFPMGFPSRWKASKWVGLLMLNSSYRAFASAVFVWGSLIILLAFGSFIESCDSKPRVASHINLASAVDPLLPQPAEPIPPSRDLAQQPVPLPPSPVLLPKPESIPPVKPQQLPNTP